MGFEITSGKNETAIKALIYAIEGIGKSTFASKFPQALFIDTEGSTDAMDVSRFPKPTSFAMLLEEVKSVRDGQTPCKTLIIDTADWAERLCLQDLLARYKKSGIEDFGYGKGYTYLGEDWAKFLNLLEEVKARGVNVVLVAHAAVRKFEQPDEMGSYDRWELKMSKQSAPITKEWADMMLFANYKTFVVKESDDAKKGKVQGGKRVMYATHHPCWDAKNRYGLPDEMPFDFTSISHLFASEQPAGTVTAPPVKEKAITSKPKPSIKTSSEDDILPSTPSKEVSAQFTEKWVEDNKEVSITARSFKKLTDNGVPSRLAELMAANGVSEEMLMHTVGTVKGTYPADMPIRDYEVGYIEGVLIAAWQQVEPQVKANWPYDLPF